MSTKQIDKAKLTLLTPKSEVWLPNKTKGMSWSRLRKVAASLRKHGVVFELSNGV